MHLFWALLILLVIVVILFWILPSLMAPQKQEGVVFSPKDLPPPIEVVEREMAQQMLASQYEPARSVVPEDYPTKQIGECPISKPMSTNLPMVDVPMHMLSKTGSTCKGI